MPDYNTTFTNVKAREVDFVSRFGDSWKSLMEVIGISNAVKKESGSKLVSYTASVTLSSATVNAGATIPYSTTNVTEVAHSDVTIKKYAKAVAIEDVSKYGAEVAIEKTDAAFIRELQGEVLDKFFDYLATGTLTDTAATFQMGVAKAVGKVTNKFKQLRKDASNVVVFVNTLDAYEYLGAAQITLQNTDGITYVKNFMGASTVILSSDVEQGTVIAIPADNLVLYYVDPSDSDFAKLGLDYTVAGDTNLIGFHANGNYGTAVGESFAIMGIAIWAEYLDGIAVITVTADEG